MKVLRASDTRKEEQREQQCPFQACQYRSPQVISVADIVPQSCQNHKDLSLNQSVFYTERDRHSDTPTDTSVRSEEHTSELQSRQYLVCRLLLEQKKRAV